MSKKGKKVWERVYNERTSYLMLLPNIIMFAVFTVYPILWALRYMLFDYRGYGEAKFVGMDNFVRVFTRDPVFWDSVVNTFVYVGGKLILTLPIAFMLAFLLSKSTRINAVSQSIIFTPTIMSSAVMALIFYLLFNTYNGEINRFLMWLGVIDENINWLGVQHAMLTVIILAVWGGVGNYMVYFIAGLTGISTDVYESAKLDGANGAQTLFRITIPLLAPVLKMILMLALVISFMDMQSIMVLTEGGPMGKTNAELTLGGGILPEKWQIENYIYAFQKLEFGKYTLNSVVLALLTVLFTVTTASMAAYIIARREFPGKKLLTTSYLLSMFISVGSVALYPLYGLLHAVGLTSNMVGLALLLTGGQAANIFMVSGFVRSVPKELDEAATIDGAGTFRIFWQIIVPAIKPILGVIALFAFRTAWNEFVTAQVFTMSNPGLKTLSVAVANLRYSANAAAEWHIMTAGASIALIPILIVYLLANRQFITGLTAGAVKG